MDSTANSGTHNGPLSSALASTFRGNLCDVILRNRNATTFEKDQVIYDAGDENQTFFFLQKGFVKVGSITEAGHELIYDVRKAGDIVGELCASGRRRQDRAVALEFCGSLSDAYDQLNTLASSDTVHRLVRVLLRLGAQLGHTSGQRTELSAYLTQEEISQMVVARRERVSTAMNFLRHRGMVDYSHRGYLVLDLKALQNYGD
jgi:CRP-like cAMP-binding protein